MTQTLHEKAVAWAEGEYRNHVHEVPMGTNRGPRVTYYQSFDFLVGGGYPWCVCFFLAAWAAGASHPLPYKSAGAHDLGNWAVKNHWTVPNVDHLVPGDGIDFNIGTGHFGMYLDHTKTEVEVVNGNVSDAVKISKFPRSIIRTRIHVPEVHNTPPPKKQPMYVITTSINGHSQIVVSQRGWLGIQKVLPRVVKNRGWNGFTIKRVK